MTFIKSNEDDENTSLETEHETKDKMICCGITLDNECAWSLLKKAGLSSKLYKAWGS
jgi:hypothetical protein